MKRSKNHFFRYGIVSLMILLLMISFTGLTWAGAVLKRDNGQQPGSLDVQKMTTLGEQNIAHDLYDGLLIRNSDGTLRPGLAKEWKMSEDGLSYTFTLRSGIKWNNGDPIVAEDFVFGLRRLMDPASAAKGPDTLFCIKNGKAINKGKEKPEALGVKAVDSQTVVYTLENPTPYFLELMAHHTAFPMHKKSIDSDGKDFIKPGKLVSSGPFALAEVVPEGHVRLDKNPHYYEASEVKLDSVYYYGIADGATSVRKFRVGEVHITRGNQGDNNSWARKNMPQAYHSATMFGTELYLFGSKNAPTNDPRVQKALAMAVDREFLVDDILKTGETPAFSFVPDGLPGYTPGRVDWADKPLVERLEMAEALLKEAGYGPDKPLKITVDFNDSETHNKTVVALADMWRDLGVIVEPMKRDTSSHWDYLVEAAGSFDVARWSWVANYTDPIDFLDLFRSSHDYNDARWKNEQYDAYIAEAGKTLDPKKRMELLNKAETVFVNEGPAMNLYHYITVRLVAENVGGWMDNPFGAHPSRYLYLK